MHMSSVACQPFTRWQDVTPLLSWLATPRNPTGMFTMKITTSCQISAKPTSMIKPLLLQKLSYEKFTRFTQQFMWTVPGQPSLLRLTCWRPYPQLMMLCPSTSSNHTINHQYGDRQTNSVLNCPHQRLWDGQFRVGLWFQPWSPCLHCQSPVSNLSPASAPHSAEEATVTAGGRGSHHPMYFRMYLQCKQRRLQKWLLTQTGITELFCFCFNFSCHKSMFN